MDDDTLIDRYIEPNPHKPGAENARLKNEGIAVWALIAALGGAEGDISRVVKDYGVPPEAVQAALAYYQAHHDLLKPGVAGASRAHRGFPTATCPIADGGHCRGVSAGREQLPSGDRPDAG